MKKRILALLCLLLILLLAGCAKVNEDNSFQTMTTGDTNAVQQVVEATQNPVAPKATQAPAENTAQPTGDPNATGFNG